MTGTDNNGEPICLIEISSHVDYKLKIDDADAACTRMKTESLSS